jgi:hypothetical protein
MDASPVCLAAFVVYFGVSAWILSSFPRPRAVALVMLIAVLFLPEKVAFDAPAIPPLTKLSFPSVILWVALTFGGTKVPGSRLFRVWLVLSILTQLGTIFTNPDAMPIAPAIALPGLKLWDMVSSLASLLLNAGLPFEVARRTFRSEEDVIQFLEVVVELGIIYAFLMMVEMRLSPQLHTWVYGFHQHDFSQAMRGDGYRPLVFMTHGLATAMFCFSTVVCSVLLSKLGRRAYNISAKPISWFLGTILFMARSMGAAIYGVIALLLFWRAKPRTMARVASVLALIVILMPALRVLDWFPVEKLQKWAGDWNAERGRSLEFRFLNEDILLEKWSHRPWFGWGGYGRSHVFDETGRDITVTDGHWVIVLGEGGVLGFAVQFLLILRPVWIALKTIKGGVSNEAATVLAGLALIVSLSGVDLVPNGLFNHLPLFFGGVIAGFSEGLRAASAANRSVRPTVNQAMARAA